MSTNYPGSGTSTSPADTVAIQAVIDSDDVNAALLNSPAQKLADWAAILRAAAGHGAIAEVFSGAALPSSPLGAWRSPARQLPTQQACTYPNDGTIGTCAALDRGSTLANGQKASLGLDVLLPVPSRIAFVFLVNSPDNVSPLSLYIDGVAAGIAGGNQWMRVTGYGGGPQAVAGRFVSPVLPAGVHSFVWEFAKNSASTDIVRVTAVEILPEVVADSWVRFSSLPSASLIGNTHPFDFVDTFQGSRDARWATTTGTNAGSATNGLPGLSLQSAAVAIGDYERLDWVGGAASVGAPCEAPFIDPTTRLWMDAIVSPLDAANVVCEIGFDQGGGAAGAMGNNSVLARYDPSVGPRWLLVVRDTNGTEYVYDTDQTVQVGARHQLILSVNKTGSFLLANGAFANAATRSCAMAASYHQARAAMRPVLKVASKAAAGARTLKVHYLRFHGDR